MHNATLDTARLVAAFGIVLFHTGAPGAAIGYAALPFFLMAMLMLGARSAARLPFRTYAGNRARRLLVPWLVWSGIYGSLKLADALAGGAPLAGEFHASMLLTGPALHLWFLPFACIACLAVHPLARTTGRRGPAMMLCVLAAFAALWLNQGERLPAPLAQWRFALPATCLGFGFALAAGRPPALAAVLAASMALCLAALALGWTAGLPQLALALGGLGLCLALPRPSGIWSDHAAACALGVYLAHPLVITILLRITPLPQSSLAMALAAALGALGLTLAVNAALSAMERRRPGPSGGVAEGHSAAGRMLPGTMR